MKRVTETMPLWPRRLSRLPEQRSTALWMSQASSRERMPARRSVNPVHREEFSMMMEMAAGPTMRGTTSGTIKGSASTSSSPVWRMTLTEGKMRPMAMRKSMMPPVRVRELRLMPSMPSTVLPAK